MILGGMSILGQISRLGLPTVRMSYHLPSPLQLPIIQWQTSPHSIWHQSSIHPAEPLLLPHSCPGPLLLILIFPHFACRPWRCTKVHRKQISFRLPSTLSPLLYCLVLPTGGTQLEITRPIPLIRQLWNIPVHPCWVQVFPLQWSHLHQLPQEHPPWHQAIILQGHHLRRMNQVTPNRHCCPCQITNNPCHHPTRT